MATLYCAEGGKLCRSPWASEWPHTLALLLSFLQNLGVLEHLILNWDTVLLWDRYRRFWPLSREELHTRWCHLPASITTPVILSLSATASEPASAKCSTLELRIQKTHPTELGQEVGSDVFTNKSEDASTGILEYVTFQGLLTIVFPPWPIPHF